MWLTSTNEGGPAILLWSLAPIMRSLWLNSKLVQAPLVVRERHSALSNAWASSSSVGILRCLRRSLIESLNSFFGRPSGREPRTSSPYSSWRGRWELSILLTCSVHRSWAFNIIGLNTDQASPVLKIQVGHPSYPAN